jgi:gas vesicle protein
MDSDNHNQHDSDSNESGALWAGLLGGLLIGGLAGAGAMFLLAPQSGKKTRGKLRRQSHELRQQATKTVEDAVGHVRDKASDITEDVRQQAEALEQRGQTVLDEQKEHWATAGEVYKKIVQGVSG